MGKRRFLYHLRRMETGLFIIGMLYLALSVVAIFNLFMQPRRRRRS
jgi:hypothetical protein